jgi:Protein of unknown function (DUF2723)
MVSADVAERAVPPAASVGAGTGTDPARARLRDRAIRLAIGVGAPVAVAVGVVVNAAPGLMPGLGFWDTGEFQTVLPILGTAHPTGFPTYVILGFVANILLTPFGEPAFRVTLVSLLAVAFAAAMTVTLVRRLTGSTAIAIAAGTGLAITPLVWANATRADPHPIHLAFIALLLVVLVTWEQKRRAGAADADRWLVAAALVFGLAAGNHSLTLLFAPPIALFVLATEPRIVLRPRLIAACAAVLVASVVLVYLELPLRAGPFRAPLVYAHPETWDGFWYVALAEQFRGALSDPLGNLDAKLGTVIDMALSQFGPIALLIVPSGLATAWKRPRYALLTGTAMVITLLFNTSYLNADISRYYLGPILIAWTWLAVVAASVARLLGRAAGWIARRSAMPVGNRMRAAFGTALSVGLAVALVAAPLSVSSSSRLEANRSYDTYAGSWMHDVLAALAPNAVIVSWWSTSTALWYGQKVEGLRPDVRIVDDRTMLDENLGGATDVIARFLGHQPVYVIRANGNDLALVLERFDLRTVYGNADNAVYEVVGVRGATG